MTKRAFERADGLLVDRFSGPDGRPTVRQLPETFHLTSSRPNRREEAISELRAGPGPYPGTLIGDGNDGSKEYCDALLSALEQGAGYDVPHALLQHVHDERVRPALVDALRKHRHINVAQVAGLAGGPGALEALREEHARLLHEETTFLDTGWNNDRASMLTTVCEGLLRLYPDELPAAKALLRLFAHPVVLNRRVAVGAAADACKGPLQTAALEQLRDGLAPFATGADHHLFLAAMPGLQRTPTRDLVQRLQALALGQDPHLARRALGTLCTGLFIPSDRDRILRLCLDSETALDNALYCISWLTFGSWPDKATAFLREALADSSPFLRWSAMGTLDRAPSQVAIELTEEALTDEPDPVLRDLLLGRRGGR